MKGLALESIAKWVIILVVVGVVVNLLLFFSDEIKRFIKSSFEEKGEVKPEIIEASKFTTSQLIIYIKSCWDKTGEKYEGNAVCYILKGNVSSVDESLLEECLKPPATIDLSKFDKTKNVTIIRFEDIGNRIVVES